jgi:hypothetical protein
MKNTVNIVILLLSLSTSTSAIASSIPGQSLIDYFGATCTSQGNWTELALNDARSLIRTLETLKADEDCRSVSGALSQLGNLENKLSSLNADGGVKLEIAKLEGQEIELLTQIGNVSDGAIVAELESSLRSIQLDKAGYVSLEDSSYNSSEISNLYSQIVTSTASAYSSIVSNQLCMDNNPSLLTAATSLTTSIAATASMVNPALGLGLAGASDFIGSTVEYFRNRGYTSRIRSVARGSTILQGLKCAMESLSNRWCQIQEAESFLNFETNTNEDDSVGTELNIISDIYDTDIPVLLNWLENVKAGAPASNSADADRRSSIFYREASLRSSISRGEGLFAENRPLYNSAIGNTNKYKILRSIINKIVDRLDGRNGPSPLTDIVTHKEAPYYLLGLDSNQIPRNGNGDPVSWSSFDPFTSWPVGNYNPSYQTLTARYEKWMKDTQVRVTQELNLVLQPDPLQILTTYSERTSNKWKSSPKDAVKNILKFIKENRPTEGYGNDEFNELYDSTLLKLENIDNAVFGRFFINTTSCDVSSGEEDDTVADSVEDILSPFIIKDCDKLTKALEIIFEEAKLEFGVIVFKNRLETIIRIAIDSYIQNSDEADHDHIATLLAADSYLEVLEMVSGTDNYAAIKVDLISSKEVSMTNMRTFSKVFGGHINSLFRQNQKLVNHKDPTIAKTYRDGRAQMCFLLASMPEWPKSVMKKYCRGMKLESLQKGGPETEAISDEFLGRNFSERNCIYSNYLKKSKIFQDWGINVNK